MVFANPVPATYLDGSYYEDVGRPFYLSPAKLAGDFAPVRFSRELAYFRKFCRRGRVLDVGCSTGAFLYQLISRWPEDYEVHGSDVSGPALDHARSLGIDVVDNFFFHAHTWQYDAVTFWATLEHVAEPKLFLEKAASLLRAGGGCFVLVPNFRSLATRLLRERYRYILPQHVNYFTRATLRLIARPWFEEVYYTSTHFNPLVIVKDFLRREAPADQERAALLQKTNRMKTSRWLGPLRLVYGLGENVLKLGDLADNCLLVLRKR